MTRVAVGRYGTEAMLLLTALTQVVAPASSSSLAFRPVPTRNGDGPRGQEARGGGIRAAWR